MTLVRAFESVASRLSKPLVAPPAPGAAAPTPPAVAPAATATAQPVEGTPAAAWDLPAILKQILAAAGAAIGVIGAVAVVGGVITYLRFHTLGFPATRAVDLTPRHTLVVVGATALIVFITVGLAAVALLFAVDPSGTVSVGTLCALGILGALALAYVWAHLDVGRAWSWTLTALTVILCLLSLRAAYVTGKRFRWFGVAVFFSVVAFGAVRSYAIAVHHPVAQPMAFLRPTDTKGKIGIFVAADSDTIWIGRLHHPHGNRPGAIYEIGRPKGTLVAIGPFMGVDHVPSAAIQLRDQLRADRARAAVRRRRRRARH